MVGKVFNRLTVISYASSAKYGRKWLCQCSCGNTAEILTVNLNRGTESCGCIHKETVSKIRTKHGHNKSNIKVTPTYNTWHGMIQRCTNSNTRSYKNYGGRGITICPEWFDFKNFLTDMGIRPVGTTIDRINVDLGYVPGNCRWATPKEQAMNKRIRCNT